MLSQPAVADTLTISNIGVTVHGLQPDKSTAAIMKNKIDSTGRFAAHPELNMVYRKDALILNAVVLRDCFDNTTYYISGGKRLWLSKSSESDVSFLMGLYVRPSVKDLKVPDKLQSGNRDWLPLPFLTYTKRIPINQKGNFEFNVGTNFFLTHATVGYSFNF